MDSSALGEVGHGLSDATFESKQKRERRRTFSSRITLQFFWCTKLCSHNLIKEKSVPIGYIGGMAGTPKPTLLYGEVEVSLGIIIRDVLHDFGEDIHVQREFAVFYPVTQ